MSTAFAPVSEHATEKASGADKVSRYGWLRRNEPGELAWIHKSRLQVDRRYQRALNDAKRKRIASRFNWAAFGALIVVRHSDGSLSVIDGQHRLAAVLSRSDISNVPVIIFDFSDSIVDEATDFLITNKDRRPLSGLESFKAMVVAAEPSALVAQELLGSIGREVGRPGPQAVACVRTICRCIQFDETAVRKTWPLIAALCAGHIVDQRLILGLFTLERRMMDSTGDKRSLLEADNKRKLLEAGYSAVMRAIGDAAAYYHKGGDVVYARGILNILNFKRRNRLGLKGDTTEVQ